MKDITPEIKQRISALYWGQEVGVYKQTTVTTYISPVHPERSNLIYIELTPLSQITDEDAKEVSWITSEWVTGSTLDPEDVPEWLYEVMTGNCANTADYVSGIQFLEISDFLRSRGYALPAFGYSVEELVNAGVFKLKNTTNE